MRTLFICFVFIAVITACTNRPQESTDTEIPNSRFNYSSTFTIADAANSEVVRKWNNALVAGNIEEAFSYVADSLEVVLSDGSAYHSTRDSLKAVVSQMMASVDNVKVGYIAAIPVKSTDRNATWVVSYTHESMSVEGHSNHQYTHELYQMVNGKIRTIYAFVRVAPEDDKFTDNTEGYSYSGSFEVLSPDRINIVTSWYDSLFKNNYSVADQFISDSVDLYIDGVTMKITRDSLVSIYKSMLDASKIEIEYNAGLAVRSTDKNDEWIMLWYNETVTNSEGAEKAGNHELYRIVDNKIRSARLFRQAIPK